MNIAFEIPRLIYIIIIYIFLSFRCQTCPSKLLVSIDFFSVLSCHISGRFTWFICTSLLHTSVPLGNISFTKPGLYLYHSTFHTVSWEIVADVNHPFESRDKTRTFGITNYTQKQIMYDRVTKCDAQNEYKGSYESNQHSLQLEGRTRFILFN